MSARWFACSVLLVINVASARADAPLSLARIIQLARTHAPDPALARARVDEARAGLVGARRFSTRDPSIEIDLGPRWADGRSTDAQTSLSVPLELGGRRGKRVAAMEAEIERERLQAANVERLTVAAAVAAYYQVLHDEQLLALAEDRIRLAEASEATARQRAQAGDVSEFEVNLARGEVARAKGGGVSARARAARSRAELALLLGLPSASVTGDLADRSWFESAAGAPARADLRVLAQEVELAQREATVASAERWPSLDVRVTYEHERDADVLLGGIAIALPLFERGQGEAARARGRARRAELELATRTSLASAQAGNARATYDAAVGAAQILAQEAVPLAIQNEAAAAASYRAGKIELGTLLVIRREVLETRREHLDQLLAAAHAGVELWLVSGPSSKSNQ